jgi:hypothetical protein
MGTRRTGTLIFHMAAQLVNRSEDLCAYTIVAWPRSLNAEWPQEHMADETVTGECCYQVLARTRNL